MIPHSLDTPTASNLTAKFRSAPCLPPNTDKPLTRGPVPRQPSSQPLSAQASPQQRSRVHRYNVTHTTKSNFAGLLRIHAAIDRRLGRERDGRGTRYLAQDGGPLATPLAGSGSRRERGRAVERCATLRRAGHFHAGADLPDHGAGLRRPRTAGCSDQPVEPERTGPSGGEPGHRQEYLARLRRALFKKGANLKPHRSRYGLTPKPDPEFDAKCADICTVYQAAPAAAEQDVHTVSIDEMTGIQALERCRADPANEAFCAHYARARAHARYWCRTSGSWRRLRALGRCRAPSGPRRWCGPAGLRLLSSWEAARPTSPLFFYCDERQPTLGILPLVQVPG